jgi:DNA-binding response OmpR family regulator
LLIVEDEYLIAMLLEDMLVELDCVVSGIAANTAQALELIETTEIDAAVLDVNLDGTDSFGVAAVLKDRKKPFIFATGYGTSRVAPEFAGAPVVQKPYRMEELVSALSQLRASVDRRP